MAMEGYLTTTCGQLGILGLENKDQPVPLTGAELTRVQKNVATHRPEETGKPYGLSSPIPPTEDAFSYR